MSIGIWDFENPDFWINRDCNMMQVTAAAPDLCCPARAEAASNTRESADECELENHPTNFLSKVGIRRVQIISR
jgi:PleD family two-component response regulator